MKPKMESHTACVTVIGVDRHHRTIDPRIDGFAEVPGLWMDPR
jgi:hypothetical protein